MSFSPTTRLMCAVIFVSQFGCADSARNEKPQATRDAVFQDNGSFGNDDSSHYLSADIEISPAATAQLAKIAKQARGTRVRLEFTFGGCTGYKTHLSIQPDPVLPPDAVQKCGDLFCVYPKNQFALAQGALIDWKETEKETGFSVTFPKKTRDNQVKTSKWVNDESTKRAKQRDEEDCKSGRLAERIFEYRKLVKDDPESELSHFRLAQLLMLDGKYADAVGSFERTLMLSPEFSKSYQLLGECLIKLNEKARAIDVLTKGWITAEKRGDEAPRDAMGALLTSLEARIPDRVLSEK